MKKLLIVLILIVLMGIDVKAEGDVYSEQYEQLGAASLADSLNDETKEFFNNNGIDPSDYSWVNGLSRESVIKHIMQFFSSGAKKPLKSGAAVLGILLISAAFTALGGGNERLAPALYAAVLAIAGIVSTEVFGVLSAAVSAIKACSTFMLSFIPIFASIIVLSGSPATAASMSSLLLAATEGVSAIAAHGILPLMGGYLAMSISSGVSPIVADSELVPLFKKTAMWVLTLVTTVFLGVLGIQTVVNASADSLAMRTAKFFLGTAVPVAGSALSEAVSTISASVTLLKSSIGIYGVVALVITMLPIVAEIVIWRLVLNICSIVSGIFSLPKITLILKAVDSMLSVLLGIMLLVCGMFIISLTVITTAGGGQ